MDHFNYADFFRIDVILKFDAFFIKKLIQSSIDGLSLFCDLLSTHSRQFCVENVEL